MIFTRTDLVIRRGLHVGKTVHNDLIRYVFQAPINLFYDVTPIGKILNRFSKDIAVVDEQIYYNFNGFLLNIWSAIFALVVASIAVPYIVAVILIFAIVMGCVFTYSMKGYRDCYQIESTTMSPLLSYF
jgi:ATP-binding cassette, subfamily C (CFTR/MRP), member 4